MNQVFVFRVILDVADEDIFRDIEVLAEQTLEELHQGILNAFGITAGEMASFYASDDEWNQGEEVPLVDMGFGPLAMGLMRDFTIKQWVEVAGKRALYVYDYLNMWTFFVEHVSIKDEDFSNNLEDNTLLFPKTVYIYGQIPEHAPNKDFGEKVETKGKGIFDDAFDEEDEDAFGDDEQRFNDYHDEW